MSEQLLVTLGVQDKGSKAQVTALKKELALLDKEFKATNKTSKEYEKGTESLKNKLTNLEKKYDVQKTKLEVYKKQISNTKEQLDKKKQALEKLSSEEGTNEKQVAKLTKEINKMEQDLRLATREMGLTEAELKALESEMKGVEQSIQRKPFEDMKKDLQDLGQSLENTGQKLQSLGGSMNSVGNTLIGLSAPIVGFAGYAVKASMDFESAMAQVKAVSGVTAEELAQLEEKAKEMGATTSKSATESADAMYYMSLAGWDTQQMLAGIEPILRLSEAGAIDLARASDLTTDSMSALGVQVDDLGRYLDIVAKAQGSANTSADALMEAYIGCGGTLKNLKVPLEESATWISILANRGIKGSEAGTSLNSVLVNLMGTSGQAKEALATLGVSAWDANGNFKGIEGTLRELDGALQKCTQEQKSQFEAMIGGKTQMDTLQALISGLNEEYTDLRTTITDSDGALLNMAETMQDTTQGNITRLKSEFEGLAISVGENLLPHINSFIGALSQVVQWFGSLDQETQQNIIRMGLFAFGTGSALKVVGGFTSGIGKTVQGIGSLTSGLGTAIGKLGGATTATTGTVGAIGKLTAGLTLSGPVLLAVAGGAVALGTAYAGVKTYSDLMEKSVVTSREELSTFQRIVAGVTGTTFETAEALEKAGIKAKSFRDNVSEDFKTAVLEAEKSVNDLTNTLRNVNLDNTFSESEQADFKNKVNTICQGAIDTINSRKDEAQKELRELLLSDGVIDETEQATLDFLGRQFDTNTTKVGETEQAVYEIIAQGLADKGFLNAEEIKQIEEHLATIQGLKLEAEATNGDEILEAKADFLARVKTMDIDEATALLQEKATLRDTEMEDIRLKYDKQIELLKLKNENATEAERVANETTIASLEQSKADQLAIEQQKWEEYLGIVEANNPAVLEKLNTFNGEILTKADEKKQGELQKLMETYPEMVNITETGMTQMYNAAKDRYDQVYTVVDETTGKVISAWSSATGKAGGFTEQMAKDAKSMGKEVEVANSLVTYQLNSMENGFVNANGEIVNSNGNVVASLQDFKKEADNTGNGILDLNGKKIEVKTNTKGEIENFQEFKRQMNSLDGKTASTTVYVKYKEQNKPANIRGASISFSRDMPAPATAMPLNYGVIPATTYGLNEEFIRTIATPYDVADMFSNRIWAGSYFSPATKASSKLADTMKPIEVKMEQKSSERQINSKELASEIARAVAEAIAGVTLQGNVQLDNGAIVGQVSNGMAKSSLRRR